MPDKNLQDVARIAKRLSPPEGGESL